MADGVSAESDRLIGPEKSEIKVDMERKTPPLLVGYAQWQELCLNSGSVACLPLSKGWGVIAKLLINKESL